MWLYSPLPRSLPAALRDVQNASPAVRVAAVQDLARFGDSADRTSVIAALGRALQDASALVRAGAARVLGELGDPAVAPRLVVALEDDDTYVRQMVIQALGDLGHSSAAGRLRRALTDPRPEVRFQAVLALPKIVPEEAEEIWMTATHDGDPHVRYVALRSLEEHSAAQTTEPSDLSHALRERARTCLHDTDVGVRCAAALLLARHHDRAGVPMVLAIVNGNVTPVDPDDEAAALERAADLGLHEARAGLEKRAFGPGRYVRETFPLVARISLARLGHPGAQRALLRDLEAWSQPRRTLAVVAVGRARLQAARPVLEAMASRPDRADPEAVQTALRALEEDPPQGSKKTGP